VFNAAMSVVTWQVGTGDRGDVTILPTLVINQRQYRGQCDFPSFNLVNLGICKDKI
jgi:hypothetical protein